MEFPPSCLRFLTSCGAALLLAQCAAPPEEPLGIPKIEPLEHATLDGPPPPEPVTTSGMAPVSGKDGKFVIRDPRGAMRVSGSLKDGRMDGVWQYFDSQGRLLADIAYRGDQRHGTVILYYVSSDGKAAGKKRMAASYADGSLQGFAKNWYPGGARMLEREFDHGILEGARGWTEGGRDMTDTEAQNAAITESSAEDALMAELEAFVQLKIREHAAEKEAGPGPPRRKS